MADSVTTATAVTATRTILRAASAGVDAIKGEKKATDAIINQLQQGLDRDKTIGNTPLANHGGGTLPRGSLVNIVV